MSDPDIPPIVNFVTGEINRLAQRFDTALERMATKEELANLALRLHVEVEARERLERTLNDDEAERKTKMTRLWAGIWSVGGAILTAVAVNILAVLHL